MRRTLIMLASSIVVGNTASLGVPKRKLHSSVDKPPLLTPLGLGETQRPWVANEAPHFCTQEILVNFSRLLFCLTFLGHSAFFGVDGGWMRGWMRGLRSVSFSGHWVKRWHRGDFHPLNFLILPLSLHLVPVGAGSKQEVLAGWAISKLLTACRITGDAFEQSPLQRREGRDTAKDRLK